MRALAPVTLLLLVVPLTWTIRDDARLTKTDTREVAARLGRTARGRRRARRGRPVAAAVQPSYRVVQLRPAAAERGPPGSGPQPEPAAAQGVHYVVVTGAVADRVLAARERLPGEARFYERCATLKRVLLRREGRRAT